MMKNGWKKILDNFKKVSLKKTVPNRRSLRLETLETRELLSVTSLGLSDAMDAENFLISDGSNAVWQYSAGKTVENASGMIVLQNEAGEAKMILEATNDSGAALHWEFVGDSAGWSFSDDSADSENGALTSVLTWKNADGANRNVTICVWEGNDANKEASAVRYQVMVEWANVSLCVDKAIDNSDVPISLVYDGPTYLDTQDINDFITRVRAGVHINTGHAYWDIRGASTLVSGVGLTATQQRFANGSWGYLTDYSTAVDSFASTGNLIQPGFLLSNNGFGTDVYETYTLTKISDFIGLIEYTEDVQANPGTYVLLNSRTTQENQCVDVALAALASAGIDLKAEGFTIQNTIIQFDDNLKAFLKNMKPYANYLVEMDFIKALILNDVTSIPYTGYSPGAAGTYLEDNGGSLGQFAAQNVPIENPATSLSTPILLASDVTATSVTLVWDSVTGAVSYNLYYSLNGAEEKSVTGITETTFTVENLKSNANYSFRLVATDTVSVSESSETVTVKTRQGAKETLKTPTRLRYKSDGTSTVFLYDETEGADLYVVYYSTEETFASYQYVLSETGSAEVKNLAAGVTYYYKVQARNTAGDYWSSSFSPVHSLTLTRLAAPENLKVKVSGTTANVTFGESTEADFYVVYYSTDSTFASYQYVTTTTESVKVKNLSHGVTYYFRVQARDTTRDFASSSFSTVQTAVSTQLEAPENLKVVKSGGTATVTFSESADADFYVVYYSMDSTFASYQYVTTTIESAEVTNLGIGTYYFRVQARDTTGTYMSSGNSDVYSLESTQLATPTGVNVKMTGTSATVTFKESAGADRYVIFYSTDPNFVAEQSVVTAETSATVQNLTLGVTYYFRVQAQETTGRYLSSNNSATRTAKSTQLDAPIDLVVVASGTTATVTFTGSVCADFYVVYYSTDSTFATYKYVTAWVESATVNNLTPGETYYFRVQARETTGTYSSSQFSETRSVVPTAEDEKEEALLPGAIDEIFGDLDALLN